MSYKFRWTLEGTFPAGNIAPTFVKVNARPNFEFKEDFQFLNEPQNMTPAAVKWEAVTTTFIDASPDPEFGLWKILAAVYQRAAGGVPSVAAFEAAAGELKLKLLSPHYTCPAPPPAAVEPAATQGEEPRAAGRAGPMGLGPLGFGNRTLSHWEELEEWTLKKCWPAQVNFGELDYSSSATCDIEVTWRYAEVFYRHGGAPPTAAS